MSKNSQLQTLHTSREWLEALKRERKSTRKTTTHATTPNERRPKPNNRRGM